MKRLGFSLIEVLTAMSIFVIIVLMMSTVFHQASVAWDSGTRKARGGMEVRTMLGFMERELQHAVAYRDPATGEGALATGDMIEREDSHIQFITLDGNATAGYRQARRIFYGTVQGTKTIERKVEVMLSGDDYTLQDQWEQYGDTITMATNMAEVKFFADPAYPGSRQGVLPRYVIIRAAVDRLNDVSGVGARSAGPDKLWDTADDISSE